MTFEQGHSVVDKELAGLECVACQRRFDPIRTRWVCPHCKTKNSCCEGEPL